MLTDFPNCIWDSDGDPVGALTKNFENYFLDMVDVKKYYIMHHFGSKNKLS
jgi:hypothetical protein